MSDNTVTRVTLEFVGPEAHVLANLVDDLLRLDMGQLLHSATTNPGDPAVAQAALRKIQTALGDLGIAPF